jgi:hypothetical protein
MGQDPVTERPGSQPALAKPMQAPQPAAKTEPKTEAKFLVRLEGHEEWGTSGKLSFDIFEGGKVVMTDSTSKPVTGTGSANGKTVTFKFANCVYESTEVNGVLTGKARYTSGPDADKPWNFRVAIHVPMVGRTFAGQETLEGYGAVSFRFIDAATVEMTDRDGATRGSYRRDGLRITMTFGQTVYTGDIRGNAISGNAQDARSHWTFQIAAK